MVSIETWNTSEYDPQGFLFYILLFMVKLSFQANIFYVNFLLIKKKLFESVNRPARMSVNSREPVGRWPDDKRAVWPVTTLWGIAIFISTSVDGCSMPVTLNELNEKPLCNFITFFESICYLGRSHFDRLKSTNSTRVVYIAYSLASLLFYARGCSVLPTCCWQFVEGKSKHLPTRFDLLFDHDCWQRHPRNPVWSLHALFTNDWFNLTCFLVII